MRRERLMQEVFSAGPEGLSSVQREIHYSDGKVEQSEAISARGLLRVSASDQSINASVGRAQAAAQGRRAFLDHGGARQHAHRRALQPWAKRPRPRPCSPDLPGQMFNIECLGDATYAGLKVKAKSQVVYLEALGVFFNAVDVLDTPARALRKRQPHHRIPSSSPLDMTRAYNFAAGPATLPLEVLEQARDELLEWAGTGCSVMEVSHRGKEFEATNARAQSDLRELLGIPSNYQVLFLQGGASMQWSQILFNLCRDNAHGDFILTGEWTTRAVAEARRLLPLWGGSVNVVASSADRNFSYIPEESTWQRRKRRRLPACLHQRDHPRPRIQLRAATTRRRDPGGGHEFAHPESAGRCLEVRAHLCGCAKEHRAGGPDHRHRARRSDRQSARRCGRACSITSSWPTISRCSNTPPTFAIYLAGLVFQWIKRQGGVAVMEERNRAKSQAVVRRDRHQRPLLRARRKERPVAHECAVSSARRSAQRHLPR